jgi:hypothetical protein
MIVDLMKFFDDIFIPSLVTAHGAPVGWRAKIYRLVNNGTTTIFMPLILARFGTSSLAAVTPMENSTSYHRSPPAISSQRQPDRRGCALAGGAMSQSMPG